MLPAHLRWRNPKIKAGHGFPLPGAVYTLAWALIGPKSSGLIRISRRRTRYLGTIIELVIELHQWHLSCKLAATGLEPRCSVEWQPQARFSTHQVGSLHRRRKLRGTQFRPPDTFFGFARRNGVDHVLHEALPRTAIERFGPAGATPPRCPPFLLVAIRINIPKRTAHGSRNPSCFDPEAPGHIIT